MANHSALRHHLRQSRRLGKIILGDQQVTLLGDAWRVAKPGANYVQQKHVLQFGMSAGPPLLKLTEWNNRGQPETPARCRSRVILLRKLAFFQPIAVFAALK